MHSRCELKTMLTGVRKCYLSANVTDVNGIIVPAAVSFLVFVVWVLPRLTQRKVQKRESNLVQLEFEITLTVRRYDINKLK